MATRDWIMDDTILITRTDALSIQQWRDSYHRLTFCRRWISVCIRAQMRLLFAHCVCLPWSGSCVCVCLFASACVRSPARSLSPCHVVGVRWQFPCLAVTEECILLQSALAAGCFGADLCAGSGVITLPVIKPNPAMPDPQHCTFWSQRNHFFSSETHPGEMPSNRKVTARFIWGKYTLLIPQASQTQI